MRTTAVVLGFLLVVAGPASAQMVGYSVRTDTGVVTAFDCDPEGDPSCFEFGLRTALGTIDIGFPAATAYSPDGRLVVADNMTHRLVWYELPSLEISAVTDLAGFLSVIRDLAFDPNGTLWMASGSNLLTVDPVTGVVTQRHASGYTFESITFVDHRLFAAGDLYNLLEIDPASGSERLVASYFSSQWGPSYTVLTSMAEYDGGLWSIGLNHSSPPPGDPALDLAVHDLDTGDRTTLVWTFDLGTGYDDWATIDIVDAPEQPAPAVPGVGRFGLAAIVVLIGLAGVLLARRVF